MTRAFKIDKSLRERRRIIRLLDFLKRDDLTGDQMERIGRRLQKSGKRALKPLVRKLWQEQNGTAIYRYTCMLDFFDDLSLDGPADPDHPPAQGPGRGRQVWRCWTCCTTAALMSPRPLLRR